MSRKEISVAIVGGGISGFVCAAKLSQLGITNSVVFDTGKHGPGGRCSSQYININGKLHIFDHVVQYFTLGDQRFSQIVSFLHNKKAIKLWPGKIVHFKMGKQPKEIKGMQVFIGTRGMQAVPECLSSLVHVEGHKWVSSVHWDPLIKKWQVDDRWFDYGLIIWWWPIMESVLQGLWKTQEHHKSTTYSKLGLDLFYHCRLKSCSFAPPGFCCLL